MERIDRLLVQKFKKYLDVKKKQPGRTHRLTGIGRQVLFVAVCVLTGMMFAGAVHATDYFNASPTLGTMISNGSVSATPISDGNASYSLNRNSTSSIDNVVFSPVGVASTFTGVSSNGATWTGSYTPPYSYNTDATHYYAYTISNGLSNGYTVNFLTGDNAANISKATGSVYNTTGAGGAGYTGYTTSASPYTANLVFNGANTVSGFTNIGTDGSITISGGPVNFAGTVNAGTIAVNYGDVNFSSNVNSTLNFGGGQVVNFYGGSDLTGNVNFNGYNGTVRLSNNSNISGNVDATTTGTGMLIFADNSTISGNIGATAALKQLDLNGSGVVQVVGATRANTVNINATGVGAFTGGLDTRWNYGELGSVIFNNSNGTVQIGNNASLYGNITTNTNNNGILTFVSGTQSMTGQIGTATHNINILNIGAAGNIGIAGPTGSASSQVTIDGNVYARNVVLNSAASSSELIMASGRNLTTNGITTAQNGLGILSLAGGTQTVTGQIGTDAMRLYQVNSGANAATSTFNDPVYAYYVHNTGTGSSTFKGDVTATHDIDVDAGTSNFEKNVSAGNVIIGSGIGNFNTISGTTNVTNFHFDGAGTANLFQGLNFTNLNYNGYHATVNVSAGKNLNGTAITTTTTGTGYLNLLGGIQTVSSTVGAAGLALNKITAGVDGATSNFTNAAPIYVNTLEVSGNGTVNLQGGLVGNLNYADLTENGTANFAIGRNLIGNVTTAQNGGGYLNLLGGTQQVSGTVGAVGMALNKITAGVDGATSNFTNGAPIYVNTLEVSGNGTVNLQGGLVGNLNFADLTENGTANFAIGRNLIGNVTTAQNGGGYLNLLGGTQEVSGTVGAAGFSLNRITAGVDGATSNFTNAAPIYANTLEVSGNGTVNLQGGLVGNLNFADLTENGTANFAANRNLIGNVTTAQNGGGYLNLLGGTQEVSGTVGATGFALNRITAGVDAATSNFTNAAPIYANTLEVSGNGTVNLQGGLVGNLNFADLTENGTANFAANRNLIGNVTTAQNGGGYLNLLGGTQEVSGTIGATGFSLNRITAGVDAATSNFTNAAPIYANTLEVSGNGTVNLQGGLVGNLNFADLTENGTANFAANRNLIGNVTTAQNGGGYLNLLGGTQEVSGTVGATGFSLNRITAGVDGATSNFTSMVYTNALNYVGNGTVVLNGQNGGNAVAGLVGTVNFANNSGTLQIGDNVNLTTGENGIQMANANNATMTFAGSSTVTGVLGGDTAGRSTLRTINAGVTGETVTFKNDVYVMPTTFHVTGNGTVNFEGDLHGQLVFNTGADGVVNVSDTKSLIVTSAIPAAVNNGDNVGSINFLGSTTLSADLGQSGSMLKAVNFNSGATVDVNQNIGHNVYALTTTIGNASTTTVADVSANDLFLGNALTLVAGTTTLNTAGAVAVSDLSPVDFAHTKNTDGTLTNNDLVTKSTTGTGAITTNGATINFAVGTAAFVEGGANGLIDAARSSSITGGAGSTLVMNGSETVNISLLGSTRNGETYTLIGVDSGAQSVIPATLQDNSFVIDTIVSRSNGDLVLTTSRDANTYVTKSGTAGHYSNNAAVILGTMAAAGTGYNADMQRVFNMLDIDQWGYGNNQANLATQVMRLAPIANMSLTQSALSSSGLVLSTTGERLTALRSVAQTSGKDISGDKTVKNGLWIKAVGSHGTQKQDGDYNGYTLNQYGFAGGADRRFGQNLVIGAALGSITADVKQTDFREGDTSRINNYQFMGYASYDITKALYLEAVLSGAYNRYDGQRLTAVGRTADYDFTGSQYGARLGMGYGINLGSKAKFTPMASVNYTHVTQSAYNETNAGVLNLRVDSQTFDRIQSGLGGRLASQWSVSGITYIPEITANWFYNAGTLSKEIVSSFEGGGDSFTTQTASIDRNTGNLGLAFTALYSDAISLKLGYNLDISKSYVGHTGSAFFCWAF